MLEQGECGGVVIGFTGELHKFSTGEVVFRWQAWSDSKQTSMQSTHMQVHTDSNKANNETSTDQHAHRCMQTLTECTAAVRDRDRDRRSSGAAEIDVCM